MAFSDFSVTALLPPPSQVTLDCGMDVMAPAHVQAGDAIFVNIEEGTYLGKAQL
jgi:hypothetical protein